jgi:hypothetical protein
MRKVLSLVFVGVLAAEVLTWGQGGDAANVLAAAREALGGDKQLAAITSLSATGHNARSNGQTSASSEFEMAMSLPDKFMRKDVLGNFSGQTIARTRGFNGDGLIEAMDTPQMSGGGGTMTFRSAGPGGVTSTGPGAGAQSPEQLAEARRAGVLAAKQDFARLTLGMFAASFDTYPVQFSYAGTADSPDGKADVIDVTGAGGFSAKLFVDQKSHLPLMLTWMAKEPVSLSSTSGTSGTAAPSVQTFTTGDVRGQRVTSGNLPKTPQELQDRLQEAQARARTVEYRLFYGGYQTVDGVKLPTTFSRSIDGKATEALTIEKYKLNQKIDPRKFDVVK